jgi:predicted membrane chloride channel (bestrophin family)
MRAPRLPASWFTPKGAVIGTVLSLVGLWLVANFLGPFGLILTAPFLAVPAALPVIVFLGWATGRGQRAYRFGTGRQHVWGYLGHDIRGLEDERGTWLSVVDCEAASGLDLMSALRFVPSSNHRNDEVKGLLLNMPSMVRLLDACQGDFSRVARFRVFLEREVWKTKRG